MSKQMKRTGITKGGVDLKTLEVGDTIYEFEYGMHIISTVTKKPWCEGDGQWYWEAETAKGKVINYSMHDSLSHYGPNVYDHMAYVGTKEADLK